MKLNSQIELFFKGKTLVSKKTAKTREHTILSLESVV